MVCPSVLFHSLIWICLMATGLQSQQHDVTHLISTMCVVRQSTVLIPCTYSHPRHEHLHTAEWFYKSPPEETVRVVSLDPVFGGRVEMVESPGESGGNCSLILRDVRDSDAGTFYFVFRTNASGQNWTNANGISLDITGSEVQVISQFDVVTEGDWVVFFCGSCIPSIIVPTYIWRKDGHVYRQNHGNNQLDLDSVRLEDGGRYSCTLSGHEGLNSSSVTVSVRPGYPPKKVSVSISGSGEIVEGDSVTLTCTSDAKPPVQIYTWFKENETSAVGSGQSFRAVESGWFYCEAQNEVGSQRSAAVSVVVTGNSSALNIVTVAVIPAVVVTSVIVMVAVVMFIRRKRGTPSEEQNTGLQLHRKIKSDEETYTTLDPSSRCTDSDYDTLHSIKRTNPAPDSVDPQKRPPEVPFLRVLGLHFP